MDEEISEYLARMVRRSAPASIVIPRTTPVIAFGDPRRARVATLGINPSWREFQTKDGILLSGVTRRLSTLRSLASQDTVELTDDQIKIVISECADYFSRNPYRRWFDPLDRVLKDGLGASFYDGGACHLDLVQWATAPAWGKLSRAVKRTLLRESLPHLQNQLRFGSVKLVVLNGREVLKQITSIGLAKLDLTGKLQRNARAPCSLYSGCGEGARFLGWSTNLQSSFGVSSEFRNQLARWLAGCANLSHGPVWRGDRPMSEFKQTFDANGHVIKRTTVASKFELLKLLQAWLKASDAQTISNIKPGLTPVIFMPLDHQRKVEINADTKRSAVEEYVKDALARGADVPWRVIRNRRGPCNKLVFRADRTETPGWYCYLRPEASGPEEV
jgi:hypothetical protein